MADGSFRTPDGADVASARPDRKALLCFTADPETEAAVKDGLAGALSPSMEFMRGDIRKAIATLRETPTPWALVVDVSGHPQPLAALEDLSGVVEPDMRVLVIGDREDLGFYRHLTRGLGVADYLYKPVTAAMVAENFAPMLASQREISPRARGGRLLTVTGARGGVGASTVAVNLAWHLAHVAQRHTLVLDTDMFRGTVPLLLNVQPGPGLRTALQFPERVDELFIERSALVSSDRLHALASEEVLSQDLAYREGACEHLMGVLRRRYALIVADAPFAPNALSRDVLDAAQQRIFVMEPTLVGIRDALRLLQLPAAGNQAHRPILVVNRFNRRGALPVAKVTEAMRMQPDILLPDLPKPIETAANMGEPAAGGNRAYAKAMTQLAQAAAGVGKTMPAKGGGIFGFFRR